MMFSIVVPVFKTEKFLPRCLDSFVAQTEGDFEVIVVDDASPSEESKAKNGASCEEIVARYDKRFRYARHEKNLSLFQARQTGLRMAQGAFVLPFDSDDYAMPKLLENLRKAMPVDVIVYQMTYDDGKKKTLPRVRYKDARLTGAEALDRFFAGKIQCAICSKAVRREIYLKAMDQLAPPRDFYFNLSEDLCQMLPVLLNAREVATISYPGYGYWTGGLSSSAALSVPASLAKAAENTRHAFGVLADFVCRNGYDANLLPRLEDLKRSTIRWYLGALRDLPDADWRACAAELCVRFDPALVAREAMLLIESSRSYRLGRMAIAPIKRLLGRT